MARPNKPAREGEGKCVKWLHEHVGHTGDGCLIWPFSSKVDGYGNFGYFGQILYAHRYMCELVNGPAPSDKHVAAHDCGNGGGGCVHPEHVRWKTPSENMFDKTTHGTQSPGGRGKIGVAVARQIQALRGTLPQREIAEMFGISRSNVGYVQRKTWRPDADQT